MTGDCVTGRKVDLGIVACESRTVDDAMLVVVVARGRENQTD